MFLNKRKKVRVTVFFGGLFISVRFGRGILQSHFCFLSLSVSGVGIVLLEQFWQWGQYSSEIKQILGAIVLLSVSR